MNPAPLLIPAVKAAIAGGHEILEVYKTDFDVAHKSDNSPLTLADQRSHRIIQQQLSAAADIPILSEEGRAIPYETRKKWERFWLIDPLDGTKEFIKKNDEFTVNIALIQGSRPILGVILVPALNVLYFAADTVGAYKIDDTRCFTEMNTLSEEKLFEQARKLPIHELRPDSETLTIVGSRSHSSPAVTEYIDEKKRLYKNVEFISAGSSLKLCMVAEGKADEYPRPGPTMEWDTAAGHAVVNNAGGVVYQWQQHQPLEYNKPDLLNPYFLVYRPDKPAEETS